MNVYLLLPLFLLTLAFLFVALIRMQDFGENLRQPLPSKKSLQRLPERTFQKSEAKVVPDMSAQEADRIIQSYLRHRKGGMTTEQIASHVFKVRLPSSDPGYPHSYPFINGNTFRAFADVVVENHQKTLPPDRPVRDGDVVFVNNRYVDHFASHVLPQIETRFILVSHFRDPPVPNSNSSYGMLENDLLIRWFAMNPSIAHPKITPIPIGLRNRNKKAKTSRIFQVLENTLRRIVPFNSSLSPTTDDDRPILVYSNFNWRRNRDNAKSVFSKVAFDSGRVDEKTFYEYLAKSRYVLSPPGNGKDCFRTYESILLGAVPIVKNSTLFPIFAESPALVLDRWRQWSDVESLREMLEGFVPKGGKGRKVVMAKYWFDIINSYREGHNSNAA